MVISVGSLCTNPWGNHWLGTVSLFAKVLWDWEKLAPLSTKARQSKGLSSGKQLQKLGCHSCAQAASRETLATWGKLEQ